MDVRDLASKIVDKSSKRWIQDVGDGFSCNLDILKEDLEYEIGVVIAEAYERAAQVAERFTEPDSPQRKLIVEHIRKLGKGGE